MNKSNNVEMCLKDSKKYTKQLLKKTEMYENFGKKEVMKLKDKYDYLGNKQIDYIIFTFEKFCMDCDDRSLNKNE